MNKNGYGEQFELFPDKKPFKLTDFEIDDYNMLLFLPDNGSKEEWLKTCQKLKDLEKKAIKLNK